MVKRYVLAKISNFIDAIIQYQHKNIEVYCKLALNSHRARNYYPYPLKITPSFRNMGVIAKRGPYT